MERIKKKCWVASDGNSHLCKILLCIENKTKKKSIVRFTSVVLSPGGPQAFHIQIENYYRQSIRHYIQQIMKQHKTTTTPTRACDWNMTFSIWWWDSHSHSLIVLCHFQLTLSHYIAISRHCTLGWFSFFFFFFFLYLSLIVLFNHALIHSNKQCLCLFNAKMGTYPSGRRYAAA